MERSRAVSGTWPQAAETWESVDRSDPAATFGVRAKVIPVDRAACGHRRPPGDAGRDDSLRYDEDGAIPRRRPGRSKPTSFSAACAAAVGHRRRHGVAAREED